MVGAWRAGREAGTRWELGQLALVGRKGGGWSGKKENSFSFSFSFSKHSTKIFIFEKQKLSKILFSTTLLSGTF
jgi:hypothetical protein